MPRVKKRKQGLVAKLDSKSFSHMSGIILYLSVRMPEDPQVADGLPDYIKRNLKRGTFNGTGLTCHQESRQRSFASAYADMQIPLGIADLRSLEDSRWVLRRLLAALHLEDMGLEKQMYQRMYLLSQLDDAHCTNGVPRNLKHNDPVSRTVHLLSFLAGVHKIVDGERKPVSAFLREALIADEGTPIAREVWAMLLTGLVPTSQVQCNNKLSVYRLRRPKTRTTAPRIANALTRLDRHVDYMPVINTPGLDTEAGAPAGWYVVPKAAALCLQSDGRGRQTAHPRSDEAVSSSRKVSAHVKDVDPRRTRLALMILPMGEESPTRYDDLREAAISPHKALLEVVNMLCETRMSTPSYVCADPYKMVRDLLALDAKELSMGMVQRGLNRVWPNGCLMHHQDNRYGSFRRFWYFFDVQHAKHTS